MRRVILALLLFSFVVNASLDQAYVHTVSRDGSSTMTRDTDLTIFADVLGEGAFQSVDGLCDTNASLRCSVDGETVTIKEKLKQGTYYSLTADYGLPFITYTLVVKKVPTDRFSSSLDNLLVVAGAVEEAGTSRVRPMDLRDKSTNIPDAEYLKKFDANLTYSIEMPAGIYEATAGDVDALLSGNTAQFDLVEVLGESEYMTVKSRELNLGYLALIAMAITLAALAFSFFTHKRPRKRRRK
jgi:hypothetical protein